MFYKKGMYYHTKNQILNQYTSFLINSPKLLPTSDSNMALCRIGTKGLDFKSGCYGTFCH